MDEGASYDNYAQLKGQQQERKRDRDASDQWESGVPSLYLMVQTSHGLLAPLCSRELRTLPNQQPGLAGLRQAPIVHLLQTGVWGAQRSRGAFILRGAVPRPPPLRPGCQLKCKLTPDKLLSLPESP